MVWQESRIHFDDGNFYMVNIADLTTKTKYSIQYQNFHYDLRLVAHCDKVPVPIYTSLEISIDNEFWPMCQQAQMIKILRKIKEHRKLMPECAS